MPDLERATYLYHSAGYCASFRIRKIRTALFYRGKLILQLLHTIEKSYLFFRFTLFAKSFASFVVYSINDVSDTWFSISLVLTDGIFVSVFRLLVFETRPALKDMSPSEHAIRTPAGTHGGPAILSLHLWSHVWLRDDIPYCTLYIIIV